MLFKTVLPVQKPTNTPSTSQPPTNVQPKKQAKDPIESYGVLLDFGVGWVFKLANLRTNNLITDPSLQRSGQSFQPWTTPNNPSIKPRLR